MGVKEQIIMEIIKSFKINDKNMMYHASDMVLTEKFIQKKKSQKSNI